VVVGIVTWDLQLAGCQSLKDKRQILKGLKDRLHNRFNVSVAETDRHDLWQRAELSCCAVATDRRQAQSVIASADQFVAGHPQVRIIDSATSFL